MRARETLASNVQQHSLGMKRHLLAVVPCDAKDLWCGPATHVLVLHLDAHVDTCKIQEVKQLYCLHMLRLTRLTLHMIRLTTPS